MKQQTFAFFLCVLISTSACGIAYAQWNDVIEIHSTMRFGTLTLRFVDPLTWYDNDDATKDTGTCSCKYTNLDPSGFITLEVGITNAYPGYEAYSTFTLKNVGGLTDTIEEINIEPGTGLVVGETYVDANGKLIGWRLDTGVPVLYVYLDNKATGLSLLGNEVLSGDQLQGDLTVLVADDAEQCHIYGFKVEIVYG